MSTTAQKRQESKLTPEQANAARAYGYQTAIEHQAADLAHMCEAHGILSMVKFDEEARDLADQLQAAILTAAEHHAATMAALGKEFAVMVKPTAPTVANKVVKRRKVRK